MDTQKCVICKKEFVGYGNNPWPIKKRGVCCNECNYEIVLPARIKGINRIEDAEVIRIDDIIDPLIKDEKEAIIGYNKALEQAQLLNDTKLIELLNHIKNEEVEHIKELEEALKARK